MYDWRWGLGGGMYARASKQEGKRRCSKRFWPKSDSGRVAKDHGAPGNESARDNSVQLAALFTGLLLWLHVCRLFTPPLLSYTNTPQ